MDVSDVTPVVESPQQVTHLPHPGGSFTSPGTDTM